MNWNKITPEIENEICEMYKTYSMSQISKKYHINDNRIRKVLLKNGVEIRDPRRSMKKDGEWDYQTECLKRYPKHDGYHYVAVSKDGKVRYDDYMNSSGILCQYIKRTYSIEIPSLFKRKKYFKEYGLQWYENYFDIIEEKDVHVETKKCPYCDWETTDIENKAGAFGNHLLYEHDMTREEYLIDHPEDNDYFCNYAHPTKQLQYETDDSKFVKCPICGKKLARIDGKHLKKHGISLQEYIKVYTGTTVSEVLHDRLSYITTEANKNMKFHNRSKAEIEIEEFLKGHGIETNDKRKIVEGKEIDIYLPKLKIGIEYNGIYYHTEEYGKDRTYHLDKTETCERNGIKLIHIFEDEYVLHKELVLNKLLHICGHSECKEHIMARKCNIREITSKEGKWFLDKYHIQGSCGATIFLGAFYNGELIAVMNFKREHKGGSTYGLTRFASNYNYVCSGIGGKLFKYFVRNYGPTEIKSFADRRWTFNKDSNLYVKLGFSFDKYTKPDYRYVGKGALSHLRIHKFNYRKNRMMQMDKDGVLNMDMTEDEMRKKLGYKRIWDCGLIKYVWRPSTYSV